jgi:hypothetical protein
MMSKTLVDQAKLRIVPLRHSNLAIPRCDCCDLLYLLVKTAKGVKFDGFLDIVRVWGKDAFEMPWFLRRSLDPSFSIFAVLDCAIEDIILALKFMKFRVNLAVKGCLSVSYGVSIQVMSENTLSGFYFGALSVSHKRGSFFEAQWCIHVC